MKKIILLSIVLAFTLNLKSQVNGVIIADTSNIQVVKVWGTHYERGYAYGYLLGTGITQVFNNYLKPMYGIYYSVARSLVTEEKDLKFDSIFKVEARAVIDGMNAAGTNTKWMDYVDLLISNSFLDIARILYSPLDMGCSSLISWGDATTGTDLAGKSVISRHLDWTVSSSLTNNQVIYINFPSEKDEQPWAGIGFSGIFGVLSGFNQNMGVFQHQMDDFSGNSSHGKKYEPIWISLRKSIEKLDYNSDGKNKAGDVRSALMDNLNGYASGYIISAMAKSTEVADSLVAMIAEVAPTNPYLIFRSNRYEDKIPGDNLYTANNQIARNDAHNYCERYNNVAGEMGDGTGIGLTENRELMREHSRLIHNLQFMQYAPELDLFSLSVYKESKPAYLHEPVVFSIRELLSAYNGIDEPGRSDQTISLYPNPVADILTIRGLARSGHEICMKIYDIRGTLFFSEMGTSLNGEYRVNMDPFMPGVYLVKVESGRLEKVLKVLKQ
ncbi:MAG: T9SS type A sorting domain-containing protein [Bacteroidales bacterium]|nr:T9SS type A sorting domain-containing protein [Bacteroidales bacterium]